MAAPPFESVPFCIGVQIFATWTPTNSVAMLTPNFLIEHESATFSDCEDAWATVEAWIGTSYASLVCGNWHFDRLKCYDRNNEDGALVDNFINYVGTMPPGTAGHLPEWAPLTLLNTGKRGYGEHGRIFNLAPNADPVADVGYDADHQVSLIASWQVLNTALLALTPAQQLGVASPSQEKISAIQGWSYSTKMTEQGRRRKGFGE